jgi:hypothetical protein
MMNSGAGRGLMSQFQSAGSRLKLEPKELDYQRSRIDRKQNGEPDWTRDQYELYKKTAPERLKEAHERYKEYDKQAEGGRELGIRLNRMNQLVNHPKFVSGDLNLIDTTKKGVANFLDYLEATTGTKLPVGSRDFLKSDDPVVLKEAFTSVAAQGVIDALGGSLGRGISTSDQQYMAKAFPDLLKSKEGIKLINDILGEVADRKKLGGKVARDYMTDPANEFRATAPKMDAKVSEALDKYGEEKKLFVNQDGSPTALGAKVATEVSKTAPAVTTPPQAARPPQGGPREGALVQGPDGKKYRIINGVPAPLGSQGL